MTHIVNEECIKCKFTDCVDVCPVDCFHEGLNFLVINPEECIDCGVCIDECPVKAIKNEYYKSNIIKFINLKFSKLWPVINKSKKKKINNKWLKIKLKLHNIKI